MPKFFFNTCLREYVYCPIKNVLVISRIGQIFFAGGAFASVPCQSQPTLTNYQTRSLSTMQEQDRVEICAYEIQVCHSIMDFAHGGGDVIKEYFVPAAATSAGKSFCYNRDGFNKTINAFFADKPRATDTEAKFVKRELVAKLEKLCELREQIKSFESEIKPLLKQ